MVPLRKRCRSKLSSSVAEHRARIVENLENARRIVKTNTELAQQRMKHYYDQNSAPVSFDIGSKVWVYTPKTRKGLSKKLAHNYHGPYRVVKNLSPVHFRLRTLDNRPVSVPVHANRMKLYVDPSDRPTAAPPQCDTFVDFSDVDLPPDSFLPEPNPIAKSDSSVDEPSITRPEDYCTPQEILPV
eukprot:gene6597-biopygen8105